MFIPTGGGMPGRTHYLDEMPLDAFAEVEREATERLVELKDDVAATESQLEQIKLARTELQPSS
jgi:hypothetical protein